MVATSNNVTAPVVYVVDDDEAVRRSLGLLIERLSPATVECYESGESFLANRKITPCECLVLDMRMPGLSGSDVLEELKNRKAELPTILISGHADSLPNGDELPSNVLAFLEKPYRAQELLDVIHKALKLNK